MYGLVDRIELYNQFLKILSRTRLPVLPIIRGGDSWTGGGGSSGGGNLEIGSESNTTPITIGGSTTGFNTRVWLGKLETLPTTSKWFVMSAVGIWNGGVANGNGRVGIAVVNAEPPTNTNFLTVSQSVSTALSGINQEQKILVDSMWLRGGTRFVPFLEIDSATHAIGYKVSASQSRNFSHTYGNLPSILTVVYSANVTEIYTKAYYRPIDEV